MVRARFSTASLVLILTLGTAATAAAAPVDRGRDLVRSNCGMCHAVGATDASPNELAPPFRVLHQRYPVENLEEALAEGILTGHPQMPEFRFSPDDVAAIIQYLKSIQTRQGAGNASPTPASRGR